MLFFTVVRYASTRASWNAALLGFIGLGAGVALLGLVGAQWFTTKLTGLNALTARLPSLVSGLPGAEAGIHPNILAGSLLWLLPPAIFGALALVRRPDWFVSDHGSSGRKSWLVPVGTIAVAGAAVLMAGVLALAQSRGAYLAAALTVLVLGLVMLPARGRRLVLIFGSLVLVIGLWWANQTGWDRLLADMANALPVGDNALSTGTFTERVEIWSRAQWAIRDAPVTGLGMDTFRVALPLLYPLLSYNPANPITHAHNELLQAALDLGLPGLAAFLALNLGAFAMLGRMLQETGAVRLLALGLGGGLLAHFLFGLIDATALGGRPGVIFWVLLGLIASLYQQVTYPTSREAVQP